MWCLWVLPWPAPAFHMRRTMVAATMPEAPRGAGVKALRSLPELAD